MPAGSSPRIARAASVVGGATAVSRLLGFLRDMVIARAFGASAAADAFFVAFRIPNALRELLGEGALSAAFIPVYHEVVAREGRPAAFRMAAAACRSLALISCLVVLAGILLAPYLVAVIAPGFRAIPGKFELTVTLTRWLFPYLLFVGLGALLMGLLNSLGHFLTPALSPALLNLAMIGAVLGLAPGLAEPVLALAYGVLIGGVLQLLLQWPVARARGLRLTEAAAPGARAALGRMVRLMGPATAGLAITQVSLFVTTLLASFLEEGAPSHLYYAFRLIHLPIGVVGVAVATAAFPTMAAAAARNAGVEVRATLLRALRGALYLTLPAMIGLIVLRVPIVRLFEGGAFGREATFATANVLLAYAVGLACYVGNRILAPAFYSFQDTASPVRAAAVAMTVGVLLSLLLMGPLGAVGLALSTALTSALYSALLLRGLSRRIGSLWEGGLGLFLGKVGAAATLMGGLLALLLNRLDFLGLVGFFSKAASVGGAVLLGAVVFLIASALLKVEEAHHLLGALRTRLRGPLRQA
jgi:putative peptidoglycan lipid II flippase